jgi:hypothetical protein
MKQHDLPILVAEFSGIRYWIWSSIFKPGGLLFPSAAILLLSIYVIIFDEIVVRYIYWLLFDIFDTSRAGFQAVCGIHLGFLVHLFNGLLTFGSGFFIMYKLYVKFKNTPKQLFWCSNHFESMNMFDYETYVSGYFNYDNLRISGKKLISNDRFWLRLKDNGIINELSLKKMMDLDKKYHYENSL